MHIDIPTNLHSHSPKHTNTHKKITNLQTFFNIHNEYDECMCIYTCLYICAQPLRKCPAEMLNKHNLNRADEHNKMHMCVMNACVYICIYAVI